MLTIIVIVIVIVIAIAIVMVIVLVLVLVIVIGDSEGARQSEGRTTFRPPGVSVPRRGIRKEGSYHKVTEAIP